MDVLLSEWAKINNVGYNTAKWWVKRFGIEGMKKKLCMGRMLYFVPDDSPKPKKPRKRRKDFGQKKPMSQTKIEAIERRERRKRVK